MESGPSKKTPDNLVPYLPSERDGSITYQFLVPGPFLSQFLKEVWEPVEIST